jgi:hypothetical protein
MFWRLFLAHLLGDYLFQPDWLVANKRRIWGLSLHVVIHFAAMVLLVGISIKDVWPKLLILTFIHLGTDWAKIYLNEVSEKNTALPYVIDQIIHIVILGFVAIWIEGDLAVAFTSVKDLWPIYASGYLVVTYVWHITERKLYGKDKTYLNESEGGSWSRMITRAILLTVWLFVGERLKFASLLLPFHLPYFSGTHRKRALLTDVIVTLVTAIIILFSQ